MGYKPTLQVTEILLDTCFKVGVDINIARLRNYQSQNSEKKRPKKAMDDHERTINKGRVSRVRALLGMKNSSLESRASLWDNSKSLAAHGARQQLQAELMTLDVLMCVQTSALPIHSFNSVHSQVHIHNSTLSTRRNTRQLATLHNVRRTVYSPR